MNDTNEKQAAPSYVVPDVEQVEFMSAAEAQQAVKQLDSDVHGDARHPYMVGGHPLHKDFVEYGLKLRERAAEGRESVCDRAMRESQQEQQRRQEKLNERTRRLFDEEMSDFEGREKLDLKNIQQWQYDLWEMQAMNSRGEFGRILPLLENHIRKLKITGGVETFRNLIWDDRASDESKADLIDLMLQRVWKKSEEKFSVDGGNLAYGAKKKPKTNLEKEGNDYDELS